MGLKGLGFRIQGLELESLESLEFRGDWSDGSGWSFLDLKS